MTLRIAPAAFAAMLTLPALAFAQTASSPSAAPTTPPAATTPTTSAAPSPAEAATLPKDVQAKVEAHIKQLHAQLKITPNEENDWNQFADVMRTNARDMHAAVDEREQQYPSMNALQNMESYQKLAETHAEHLQKLVSAFESLYNALPDPQKKVADQVFKARVAAEPRHAAAGSQTHG